MQGLARPNANPASPGKATPSGLQGVAITPSDVRKLFMKRKWFLVIGVLLGFGVALYHVETVTPQYEAVTSVDINLNRTSNIGFANLVSSGNSNDWSGAVLNTQLRIMQSSSVAKEVIRTLHLYNKPPFSSVFGKAGYQGKVTPLQMEEMSSMLRGNIQVLLVPNTNLVQIFYTNPDPAVAQEVVNQIVTAYQGFTLRTHYQAMTHISGWLSRQMASLQRQVSRSQTELSAYEKKHNLLTTGKDEGSLLDSDLAAVNQQLADAKADRIVKEARYKMAQTRNPDLLVSVAPNTVLASLRNEESNLMAQRAQLQSKFGPNYPKLIEVNQQLASVRKDINREISNLTKRFQAEYDAAVQTQNLLQNRLEKAKEAAYKQNATAAQAQILEHDAQAASALYDTLQLRLQEAGITAGLNSDSVEVIDKAVLPQSPVSPAKKKDLLYGVVGGFLIGLFVAIALETLDDTVRTSEDAENTSRLPALSVVPQFAGVSKRKSTSPGKKRKQPETVPLAGGASGQEISRDLVTLLEPQSLAAESFRTLRSSVLLSSVDREPRVILVTSGLAAEGKSTCAANLAISFAQRPAKVLLVDTDLRKGTVHLKFRVSNRAGLSTYLTRETGEASFSQPIPSLPGLSVLPRGPVAPNPGEMLSSAAMGEAINQWRKTWDYIILDTSPLLAVSDSLNLIQYVDGSLLVIRSGLTRKKALQKTTEMLQRVDARILGTIVNGVDLRLENYNTYSRGYAYSYRGGYGSTYGTGYGVKDGDDES
jgi:polysaccharide biosynthesis transport protein